MTPSEIARLLEQIAKRWPDHPVPVDSGDVWLQDLAAHDREDVEAAMRRLAADRDFPPKSAQVVAEVQRALQGAAPGFDEMLDAVWRALPLRVFIHGGIYNPAGQYSPSETARAIAVMQAGGAHESACRFVASVGLRALCTLPDGTLHGLDIGQEADRRDMSRHYRDQVLPDWRRDPRPGVALERACRVAQLDPAAALTLAERTHTELAPPPVRPALPASPVDEGPMIDIDPAELLRTYRAERAAAATRRRGEEAARWLAADEAQRAALAELAAHHEKAGAR